MSGRKVELLKQRERNREIDKAKVNPSRNMLPRMLACYTCFPKSHYLNYLFFTGNTSIITVQGDDTV